MNTIMTKVTEVINNELLPKDDEGQIILAGDILFRFKSGYSITTSTLCRVSFNVSFLKE